MKEDRRNFQKLLKMVMNREVSEVVIACPDRLTRFGIKILGLRKLYTFTEIG